MEWTKTNVQSTFHICWAAQAALYYHYGIPKYPLAEKLSGIFAHRALTPKSRLFRGFDDIYQIPHSRHTEVRAEDIEKVPELKIMSVSDEAGVHIVGDRDGLQFFVTGHSEYDAETIGLEYQRDMEKGLHPHIPSHYYPDDDRQKRRAIPGVPMVICSIQTGSIILYIKPHPMKSAAARKQSPYRAAIP